MLKKFVLNGREIPVPIPLVTLGQVVSWVETTLAKSGQVITCIILNGKSFDDLNQLNVKGNIKLSEDTLLEMRLESPKDLLIQSLETIYDLAKVVQANIKQVAVDCWKFQGEKSSGTQLTIFLGDLKLILSLLDQVIGLAELFPTDTTAIQGIYALISSQIESISREHAEKNWREISRILLHRCEVSIKDLSAEIEIQHIQALSQGALTNMDVPASKNVT